MGTLLNEELEDQILHTKINYLNGYLDALAWMSCYSIIGMNFKLFLFHYYGGDLERTIQNNSYELFSVHSDDWEVELEKAADWEERLKKELYSNFERGLPYGHSNTLPDYSGNILFKHLDERFQVPIDNFVSLLKDEFVNAETDVYELKVTSKSIYRIVGIDLVFEITPTRILVLQIGGSD
jgi:hypothetical protein